MTDLIKIFKKSTFLFLLGFAMMLASCSKEEASITTIENLADSSIESIQQRAIGKNACLEFVFPVSIQFIDESIATAESYETLYEVVSTWFEENEVEKIKGNKPQLIFPIDVLNEDGEVVSVASNEELKVLRSECPGSGKCKGKKGKGFKCFSLVYPVSLTIDGVATEFQDRDSLKDAIKAYKESAGDEAEKPTLVFPVTVEYDDGTQTVAESQEQLALLKEACRAEEG